MDLVTAVTGHTTESVCSFTSALCSSLFTYWLSLLTLGSCSLITLNCLWFLFAIDVIFQFYDGNCSFFLGSPSSRRNRSVLFAFLPLYEWTRGWMVVSRLINNSGIRWVTWYKIWLIRQQGLGVGPFPLARIWAGRQWLASCSINSRPYVHSNYIQSFFYKLWFLQKPRGNAYKNIWQWAKGMEPKLYP